MSAIELTNRDNSELMSNLEKKEEEVKGNENFRTKDDVITEFKYFTFFSITIMVIAIVLKEENIIATGWFTVLFFLSVLLNIVIFFLTWDTLFQVTYTYGSQNVDMSRYKLLFVFIFNNILLGVAIYFCIIGQWPRISNTTYKIALIISAICLCFIIRFYILILTCNFDFNFNDFNIKNLKVNFFDGRM
jgi:hypothetical protein